MTRFLLSLQPSSTRNVCSKTTQTFWAFLFFLAFSWSGWGQANTYNFVASSGAYTPLTTYTDTSLSATEDDAITSSITLPFTFTFAGSNYTTCKISSNGWLTFGTTTSSFAANSSANANTAKPIIMPLWDDLQCIVKPRYTTLGSSPTRAFVIEWNQMEWNYGSGADVLGFQIILYETTNVIEFIYRQGTDTVNSGSATIGIYDAGSTYITLNNSGSSPTAQTSTFTTNISSKPASGQIYRFSPPSCSAPTLTATTGITTTTANINWNAASPAPSGGYQWEVRTSGAGGSGATGLVTSGNVGAGVLTATVSGLTANTTYSVYVRSDCGSSTYSSWASGGNFTTLQNPASIPYSETFETWPNGWSIVNGSQTNKWAVGTATAHAGTQSAYISNDSGTTNAYSHTSSVVHAYRDITFPSSSNSFGLSFYYKGQGESGWDDLKVYLVSTSTTPSAGTSLSSGQIGTAYGLNASWQNVNLTLANTYANQTWRLVFSWRNDGSGGTQPPIAVDDISIVELPCVPPSTLTATSITNTTANLGWTAVGSETTWNVEYGPTGFTQGLGTAVNGTTSNPLSISGLTSNTAYQFYVQADCGGSGTSTWAGPFSFTTQLVEPIPYLQEFPTTSIPAGWGVLTGYWYIDSTSSVGGNTGNSFYTELYYDDYWGYGETTGSFRTVNVGPVISGTELTFDYRLADSYSPYAPPANGSGNFIVAISTDYGSTYTNIATVSNNGVAGWQHLVYNLSSYAGQNVRVKFTANWNSGDYVLGFDNVYIQNPPTCFPPTALTLGSVTNNSAAVSWTAPVTNPPGIYDIYYSTTNTAPISSTTPTVNDNSGTTANLSSLSPNTLYYWWVRSDCGGGDTSVWASGGSFLTNCDNVTSLPFLETFDTTSSTIGCWRVNAGIGATVQWGITTADASHGASAPAASTHFGYLNVFSASSSYNTYNLTSPNVVLDATPRRLKYKYFLGTSGYSLTPVPLTVQISVNGGAYTNLYTHTSANSTFATSSTSPWQTNIIDLSAYSGSTVNIRFVSNSNYGSGTCNQGLDEFSIEEFPACPDPSVLVSSNVLNTSATLSWTAASAPETTVASYDYYYSTSSTAPDGSTIPSGSTVVTSVNISGLTPSNTYYYWVRSDCTVNESNWVAGGNFTTTNYIYIAYVDPATANINQTMDIYFIDYDAVNNFYSDGQDPIWMYCGVDTNSGHWQYTGGNLSTTSTLIPFAAQGGGLYKATVNLAQYLCIPEGTMVYGIDLLFRNQYWSSSDNGGNNNNKTNDLYINIGDANLAINPPTGVVASSVTHNSATLSWTAPTEGDVDGYEYYVSDVNTPPSSGTSTSNVSVGLTGLTSGTIYYYWVRTKGCGSDFSDWTSMGSFTTHCQTPVLTAIDGESCGSGAVNLSVSSDIASTINWYAAATGGSSLGTGVNYTTPSISSTTSYWAQAFTTGGSQNLSILQTVTPNTINGTTSSTDAGIVFTTTTANIPIKGAKIFVSGSGNMTFKLQTSTGVDIATTIIAVTGATTSSLYDITFPATFVTGTAGSGYRLLCTAKDAGINWYYQTGTYPFSTSLNELSVTNGWGWGAVSTDARCIFGITVEASEICSSSPRTEVVATITPAPALTLSSASENICNYTSTGTVILTAGSGDYDNFIWNPATNVSGDQNIGWTFNPTSTTTYTLTASQSGGSQCSNTATFTVNITPAATPVNIVQSNETICGGIVKSLSATGGVGNDASTLFTETANVLPSSFTIQNNAGTGTAVLNTTYYSEGTGSVLFNTASTSANVRYQLNSNINLVGSISAQLSFSHIAAFEGSSTSYDFGLIDYSTDGGSTWNQFVQADYIGTASTAVFNANVRFSTRSYPDWIAQFTSDTSTPGTGPATSLWKTETFNIPVAALTSSQFRIRFRYTTDTSTNFYGWLIDNIKITKVAPIGITWTPTTNLFTDVACTTAYVGGNYATLLYARPETTTTYTAQAAVGSCITSDTVTYSINSNTYASGAWSGGSAPNDAAQTAIIDDNLTVATDITACGCIVKSGRTLTIPDAKSVTVHGNVLNNGTIDVANEGSFVQTDDLATLTGAGTYKVNKTTGAYVNYDYIYWSSPLDNETLGSVFAENPTGYKYSYNTANFLDVAEGEYVGGVQTDTDFYDGFDDNGNDWVTASNPTVMEKGKGYIVLGKGSPIPFSSAAIGLPQPAQSVLFDTGKFNNGVIPVTVSEDKFHIDGLDSQVAYEDFVAGHLNSNFLGNPYPSAIDINELFADNSSILTGTFYFWTHDLTVNNTGGPNAYDFYNSSFATGVTDGTTFISTASQAGAGIDAPEFIASGQGFMANVTGNGTVNFNNSMRVAGNNDTFLRTTQDLQFDRVWLNLTTSDGLFRQVAVAFQEGKSDAFANGEDAPRMTSGRITDFYSIIENDPRDYAIQTLNSFNINKTVPLGVTLYQTGDYQINLDHAEGIFTLNQKVYLEDTYLNVIHNLTEGPYTFNSAVGTEIEDRFILRFTNDVIGIDEDTLSHMVIYPNPSKGQFYFNYRFENTASIEVYDLTGKKLSVQTTNLSDTNHMIDLSQYPSGVYYAKITDGSLQTTKKLIVE